MNKYNKRVWLNPETSHFTGALVCHDGVVKNQGRPAERYIFVELSSCHTKMRLHSDKNAGTEEQELLEFRDKLALLIGELVDFKQHLNTEIHKLRIKNEK